MRVLTIGYVEKEITNFIRRDYLTQIRKAIEQKTKILFIDGTQSSVGFALNKLASDTNTNFDINKLIVTLSPPYLEQVRMTIIIAFHLFA